MGRPLGVQPELRRGLLTLAEDVGLGWDAEGGEVQVDCPGRAQDLREQLDLVHSLEERETLVLLRRLRHPHEINYRSWAR